jgi:hypothetical protein
MDPISQDLREDLVKAGYDEPLRLSDKPSRMILTPGGLLDKNKQFAAMAICEKHGLQVDVRLHGTGQELIVDVMAQTKADVEEKEPATDE